MQTISPSGEQDEHCIDDCTDYAMQRNEEGNPQAQFTHYGKIPTISLTR